MASFTDAIPQFNPYIQQLPVEAMVSVGMEKQQRYDQGLQRIQSQIDQVAGLSIARPQDKEYLQSKLNQLGSKLKTVAAADFSNYQLVNSVAGMAGSVAKDPNVISSVESTAKYKNSLKDREAAVKDGKGSASNDFIFKRDVDQWMNSPEIGKSFNGSYEPYSNYKKNATEIIKALTKSSNITEDAFTTDKNGKLVIADAIVRKELNGISPEQIEQALLVGLSPNDFRQMQIDGIYNYSNISDDKFVNTINTSYQNDLVEAQKKKSILEASISTTTSTPIKESIKAQIDSIDKYIGRLKLQYEDVSSTFKSGDLDSAKAKLQTRNFISQFANTFSYTELSETYEDSPFAEAERWRQGLAWDKTKQEETMAFNERWKRLEYEQKERLEGPPPVAPGTVDQAIPQEELPKLSMPWLVGKIESSSQSLRGSDIEFIKRLKGVENVSDKDINELGRQYEEWLKRPEGVESNLRNYFQKTDNERRSLRSDTNLLQELNTTLDREFPGANVNTIPVQGQTFILSATDGKKYAVSPRDLLNFSVNYETRYQVFDPSKGTGFGPTSFDSAKAKRELSPKDYEIFKMYARFKTQPGSLDSGATGVMQEYVRIKNSAALDLNKNVKAAGERGSQILNERYTTTQGLSRSIPLAKPEEKDTFRSLLTGISQIAQRNDGKLANSPNFDYENLLKVMGSSNMSATITSTERTEAQEPVHIVTVVGDGTSTSFRISESQKQSMFPGQYQADPRIQFALPYIDQIRKMGGVSTSFDNKFKSSHNNSFLTKVDFPNVSVYGITGNLATLDDGDPLSNKYNLKINVFNPATGTWIEDIDALDGAMPVENIQQALGTLTDVEIYRILNDGKTPSREELSKLKENSKRPF
jgi:hypothetical protein